MNDKLDWLQILLPRIDRIIRSVRADISVFARFLDSGAEIAIDADREMDTMSLIKVPVLVALTRAVDSGRLALSDPVVLADDDKRQGSGVLKHFDAGARFTLGDAARLMIVVSDNGATDLVLRALGGPAAVNQAMNEIGLPDLRMTGDTLAWFRALARHIDPESSGLPPTALFDKGWPKADPLALEAAMRDFHFNGGVPFSLGRARSLGQLFGQILDQSCASPASCKLMRTILEGQQLQYRLPRFGLGLTSAHKTGDFPPFIANDGGIFTTIGGSTVILVVLTRYFTGERERLDEALGRIAELIFLAADMRVGAGAGSRT
ncbi:MAG: serine hydrolase [Hyphomicrobiaceae bacterium]|nr:serine hydrolase [Hyphomicrobiaceae bacterium]